MYRKRKVSNQVLIAVVTLFIFFSLVWVVSGLFISPSKQAVQAVKEFSNYEQKGNFSDSWELFHPIMKDRFGKEQYIQERSYILMNLLGVEAFSYKVEGVKKISGWRITEDVKPFNDVYKMKVTHTLKGKYGKIEMHQEVFAVKEEGEWKIIWDYSG